LIYWTIIQGTCLFVVCVKHALWGKWLWIPSDILVADPVGDQSLYRS
jgi:hypothetical protein